MLPRWLEMSSQLPVIAVTMGDPAGVGPEVCLRLLAEGTGAGSAAPNHSMHSAANKGFANLGLERIFMGSLCLILAEPAMNDS